MWYSWLSGETSDRERRALDQLVEGYRSTQLVYAAAGLQLADRLAGTGATTAGLAAATGADRDVLGRLLRALCALGVVREAAPGRWELGPLGVHLRTDAASGLHAKALLSGDIMYRVWGEFSHTLATGEPGFRRVFGEDFFEFLQEHPREATLFTHFMARTGRARIAAAIETYDFSRFRTIVDVGGGDGTFLAALLTENRAARGVLLERPAAADHARRAFERLGLAGRCTVIEGDFFESVPAGGDAYVLSRVVSDWDDDRCERILRNCRSAMVMGGKLVVVARVLAADEASRLGALLDLHLLMLSGGRERTESQFRALLERAGFCWERALPTTRAGITVIEGSPAFLSDGNPTN
jgi:hypothetical protein